MYWKYVWYDSKSDCTSESKSAASRSIRSMSDISDALSLVSSQSDLVSLVWLFDSLSSSSYSSNNLSALAKKSKVLLVKFESHGQLSAEHISFIKVSANGQFTSVNYIKEKQKVGKQNFANKNLHVAALVAKIFVNNQDGWFCIDFWWKRPTNSPQIVA